MILKKMTAVLSALAMSAGALASLPANTIAPEAASKYNYAEALQKSMFFYEVQQSGVLPEWNEVQWRADAMVDESGKDTDEVPGGWFDAGDHFKFTLTNAYSASIMAWGYIEYEEALKKAGLDETLRNNIQWGLDYVLGCDKGGGKMVGTIGDFKGGSTDHNIWCSAEVYLRKHHLNNGDWTRPYDVISNASVAGLSAAALAQGYIMFKDTQPTKAAEYLEHAKDLFEGANKIKANKDIGGMAGMYDTSSWIDDCMYAANWLYRATGDKSYLDICEKEYIPNFPLESQSSDKKFTWGLCWDDTTQAAALLYAQNTGSEEWINHVKRHLNYWMNEESKPFEGKYTSDGLAWLTNWGCLRHAANTAWIAKLASDTIFKDDSALVSKYNEWADGQMNYMFGDNKLKLSYVLGMGDNNPTSIHHRTASGIHDDHWNELGQASGSTMSGEEWQTEYAHTLYGALVGGPDSSGNYGNYKVSDYQYTEVAIDYNAGYTAALCALVDDYGGTPLADFPPVETPTWDEWEVAAVLNGSGDSYTEIKAWAMNHTAWPARVAKDISYRYYFDISELLDAGLSADDVKVEGKSQQYSAGAQGYATVSGPYQYDGNIYYAEVKFEDGRAIQPTGQSEHRDEVQFRVSIPDAIDGKSTKGAWDPSNDWSYEGVTKSDSLKSSKSLNKHFTMYVDGKLVWGEEPDGTVPEPYTPPKETNKQTTAVTTTTTTTTTETTTTTTSTTQPTTEPTTQPTTESTTQPTTEPVTTTNNTGSQGGTDAKVTKWGDANCDGGINMGDVVLIMQSIANIDKYGVNGSDKSHITAVGLLNADVFENGSGITGNDALAIQKFLLELIPTLPES